ncbi:uncharacterized protein FIBRA_08476 [Fibroporia radiculosa]|uniref:Peptidase A1 domain-containing protein n=1 Tax=Fibroporia radiculosa TaxID=599839 RepID=J4GWV6_9APHY|nr:uncharacterized protein FIBRA_08476 [Fibroporia radiculosa]CCM06230.1 predicted protein [Fibroporia radiculosa]
MVVGGGFSIPISRVPRHPSPNTPGSLSDVSVSDASEFAYLVNISIGGQSLVVLLDTGSSDLWAVSSNCTTHDCQSIPKYNVTDNSSFSPSGTNFHLEYLIGSVTGNVGADTVTLGDYEISSQILALANSTSGLDLSGTGYSGILGLSFPVEASIPDTSGRTLIENVFASLNASSRYFAFKLGRNTTDSSFTIGQLDPAVTNTTSGFNYFPVSSSGGSDYNYWKLPLQRLTINSTDFYLSDSHIEGASSPLAILDTGTTLVLGPSADVDRFWLSIGGARKINTGWQVRCNRAVVVGFVLGDAPNEKEYVVDPADMSWEGGRQDDWCMGGIQANDGVFSGDWLLGDTFLRNVYASHHAASGNQPPLVGLLGITDGSSALAQFQKTRGIDTVPPATILAQPPREDKLTGADICGIAVSCGFVFGTLFAVFAEMCCMRRRIKRAKY